jgi:chorismate--pyruvate lyase
MWESPLSFSLSSVEREWLVSECSLTKKLIALSENNFRVEVCREFFVDTLDETFSNTDIALDDSPFFIREVILFGKNMPWVFAQSVIPRGTLNEHEALRGLGNTSLGSYLFAHSQLHRENIRVARLQENDLMHRATVVATGQNILQELWARCSTFWLGNRPLLVAEVFLPGFWEAL